MSKNHQSKDNSDTRSSIASAIVIIQGENIEFQGDILANLDISAVAVFGNYLLIGADEGNQIQVLQKIPNQSAYQVSHNIELPVLEGNNQEVDLESLTVTNNTVYVVSSHCLNRKTIKSNY